MLSLQQLNAIRHGVFLLNIDRLEELAWRALHVLRLTADKFFMVCIDYDDSTWRPVADLLIPGHDWLQYAMRNEKPIARGSVLREGAVEMLSQVCPEVSGIFERTLQPEEVVTLVLAAQGASVYVITARAGN